MQKIVVRIAHLFFVSCNFFVRFRLTSLIRPSMGESFLKPSGHTNKHDKHVHLHTFPLQFVLYGQHFGPKMCPSYLITNLC